MVTGSFAGNVFLAVCLFVAVSGCVNDDDETELVKLSEVIGEEAAIEFNGDIGEMTFHFDPPLNMSQKEEMESLLGDAVNLTIMSAQTGVSCALTNGALIEGEPTGQGEYSFTSDDGANVVVRFFNGFDGKKLSPEKEYSALIEVAGNPYFAVESFNVSVLFEQL
jgi:hypothetical protein